MCAQRVMVYGSETWPMSAEEMWRMKDEGDRENDKMDVRSDMEEATS